MLLTQRALPVLALAVAVAASSALAAVCFVDDFSSGASRLFTEPCDEPGSQPFAVAEYSLYDPFHGSRGGKYLTNSSVGGAFCAVTSRRLPVRDGVRVSMRVFPQQLFRSPGPTNKYCELMALNEANLSVSSFSILFREWGAWKYADISMSQSSNVLLKLTCDGFDSDTVFAIDSINIIDPDESYCEVMFPESATATPPPNTNTTMIPPTEVCKKTVTAKVVTTTVTTYEWAPEDGSCGCGPSP